MEKRIRIIERLCVVGIILLSAVILAGVWLLYTAERPDPEPPATEAALTEWAGYLPDGVFYGQRLPVTAFLDGEGASRDLSEWAGRKLMLLFWGSWCPHCDGMLQAWQAFETVLLEHPDYDLLLIDKLDPGKGETVEKARAYLAERGVPFECLYDEGLNAYKAYGVKRIPTLLALDGQGYLRWVTAEVPTTAPELRAMLERAESGGAATERFLLENMLGEDGGLFTTYLNKAGSLPTGRDVLSESQGLLMEYAALTGNRALFERCWQYARDRLGREGVFAWYRTEEGAQAEANALVDDLRIYRALTAADALWGGFRQARDELAEAILAHNAPGGRLAGFYDFRQKRAGSALPLFSLDLEALDDLGLRQQAEEILRGGMISDAFPLYYASYDQATGAYSRDSLNTSEALTALLHAARAGLIRQTSIDWLEQKVVTGTLAARYDVDGQVVKGFDYHSTAAYALAALIGAECGNARLYTCARHRMEAYAVTEPSPLQGSFSDRADGSDIIAFDQLLPLLVYAGTGEITFDD